MSIKEKTKNVVSDLQNEGKVIKGEESKDKVYTSERAFASESSARSFMSEARKKLFDINNWSNIPAVLSSNFQLYNPSGELSTEKSPKPGDYIRIDLPGPFPVNWVKVVDVKDEENFSEFTVAPSEDPTDKENQEQIKHFFHEGARSTFRVEQKGDTIYASEIGKNEAVNTNEPASGNREVVNTIVAEGGWAVMQKIQWKNLTDYVIGLK